jgi:hypothetical protein
VWLVTAWLEDPPRPALPFVIEVGLPISVKLLKKDLHVVLLQDASVCGSPDKSLRDNSIKDVPGIIRGCMIVG